MQPTARTKTWEGHPTPMPCERDLVTSGNSTKATYTSAGSMWRVPRTKSTSDCTKMAASTTMARCSSSVADKFSHTHAGNTL